MARNLSVMVSCSAGKIAVRSRVSSLMIIDVTNASIQSKVYGGMRMKFRYTSSLFSRSPVSRLTNATCSARSSIWGAAHRLPFLQRLLFSRRRLIAVYIANENAVTCFLNKGAIFLWTLTRCSPKMPHFC